MRRRSDSDWVCCCQSEGAWYDTVRREARGRLDAQTRPSAAARSVCVLLFESSMGVHNLWSLLAPCGRRTSVDRLARMRLAVDASIWLIQFIKAMRDEKGEMLRNAPLLGLFRRLVKLLRIKGAAGAAVFGRDTRLSGGR